MTDASFASLEPKLLARKGGAKPAMRPQLAALPEMAADEPLEDLGWNDMGDDAGQSAEIVALKQSAKPKRPATRKKPAAKPARRAAFTLRLDPDRHLKLRLAATMHSVSAQVLVTEALDAMLAEIENLEDLARRVKRN